jgi:hypothetical protein
MEAIRLWHAWTVAACEHLFINERGVNKGKE